MDKQKQPDSKASSSRQNPEEVAQSAKGHSTPVFQSVADNHKTMGVDPSIIQGHARGADMSTPPGHTTPTFTPNPSASLGSK